MKKENIFSVGYALGYSFITGIIGLSVPFIISFLLFGLSGINEKMVTANNILMGIIGGPIIILLTNKYYKKYSINLVEEMDLFKLKGIKKSILGIVIGLTLAVSVASIAVLCGGEMVYRGVLDGLSSITGILTFFGMAVLEECIFRGILKSVFSRYGTVISIIIPSILFMIIHMDLWSDFSFTRVVELFLAGVLFGMVVLISNSLTCAVVGHALYNILIDELFGIDSSKGIFETSAPLTVFNMSGERVTTLMFILVQLVIILALVVGYKKKLTKSQ